MLLHTVIITTVTVASATYYNNDQYVYLIYIHVCILPDTGRGVVEGGLTGQKLRCQIQNVTNYAVTTIGGCSH